MAHSTRVSPWIVAALAGTLWFGLSACSSDPDDPSEPTAPGALTEQTAPADGVGVPLQPGSNQPPSGSTPNEFPAGSNPGAGTED